MKDERKIIEEPGTGGMDNLAALLAYLIAQAMLDDEAEEERAS